MIWFSLVYCLPKRDTAQRVVVDMDKQQMNRTLTSLAWMFTEMQKKKYKMKKIQKIRNYETGMQLFIFT